MHKTAAGRCVIRKGGNNLQAEQSPSSQGRLCHVSSRRSFRVRHPRNWSSSFFFLRLLFIYSFIFMVCINKISKACIYVNRQLLIK